MILKMKIETGIHILLLGYSMWIDLLIGLLESGARIDIVNCLCVPIRQDIFISAAWTNTISTLLMKLSQEIRGLILRW